MTNTMSLEIAHIIEGANVPARSVAKFSPILEAYGFELVRNIGGRTFTVCVLKGRRVEANKASDLAASVVSAWENG